MAESSWPGEAPTVVAERQFELMMNAWYSSGIVGNPGDDPILFADSTGMQVKIPADRYARVRGFMWSSGDSTLELPISSNSSGSTRIDRVVLRLDRSTWEVRAAVIEGTPGAGAPSVTQDLGDTGVWELWIGDVTVPDGASTISSSQVDSRTTFLGPPLLMADGADLPSPNVPKVFLRWREDQQRLILHRQGAPTAGQVDLWSDSGEVQLSRSSSFWEPQQNSIIQKIGHVVMLRLANMTRIGGNLSSNSNSRVPGIVPSSMRHPTRNVYITARTTGHDTARIRINHGGHSEPGRIELINHPGYSNGQWLMPSTVTWLVP